MFKKKKNSPSSESKPLEEKELSLHDVRKAIHAYADDKPSNVPLDIIINDDLTLDYHLLRPYLHGKPKSTYYMSKQTYELFEEDGYELAKELDMVQEAVDQYISRTKELPIIESDPYKKINFFKLEKEELLPHRPSRDFYLTKEEFMITYRKPK